MILYRDSLSNRFYCRYYGENKKQVTANFCDWFWGYIFACLSLPLSWVTLLFSFHAGVNKFERIIARTFWGFILQFFVVLMVAGAVHNPIMAAKLVGGVAVGVAVLLGFIYLVTKYEDWQYQRKEEGHVSMFKTAYKSFKDKYCPRIEWR